MKKIYCSECKYIKLFPHAVTNENNFWCMSNPQLKSDAIKEEKYYMACKIKNKNNDCVSFKKKWWKIWVKT